MSFQRGGIKNPAAEVHFREWWSDVLPLVTITATLATIALPTVSIAPFDTNLGVSPIRESGYARVIALFKFRAVEDTSGVLNRISNTTVDSEVQVRRAGGTFLEGVELQDNMVEVAANARGGGDVWLGNFNFVGEFTASGDYNFQFLDVRADGANLLLRDVQTGLRLYWRE